MLQGSETWLLTDLQTQQYADIQVEGTDTQTTFGSFVNDDLLVHSSQSLTLTSPSAYSEVDLMNFGSGFENEWASISNGEDFTVSDTVITPFGDYTVPLGTSPVPTALAGASIPADAFSTVLNNVQHVITEGQTDLTTGAALFSTGDYAAALNYDFAGVNNLVFATQENLLVGGYAALTGGDVSGYTAYVPLMALPSDYTEGAALAQILLTDAQAEFTGAFSDFATNHVADGLGNLSIATAEIFGQAPEAIILGIVSSLAPN